MSPAATLSAREATYPFRALGVLAAWGVSALPLLFGLARCPVATLAHVPCPGCGLTRATLLFLHGQPLASVHMHPLALPSVAVILLLVASTVIATYRRGAPTDLMREPTGRLGAWAFVVLQALSMSLWIARFFGAFGGPVPV